MAKKYERRLPRSLLFPILILFNSINNHFVILVSYLIFKFKISKKIYLKCIEDEYIFQFITNILLLTH